MAGPAPGRLKREIAMQSMFVAAALILAIASPVGGKAAANSIAGHGVSTGQHLAGFGLPRLPGLPHLPRVPKPR
jgi:hypothetical protein